MLISKFDVFELAAGIARGGGLSHAEQLIAIEEKDGFTIVEGNRRLCACQLLLNPRLVSAADRKHLPEVPAALKKALRRPLVVIAPSRRHARRDIGRRHLGSGTLKWTEMGKQRAIVDLVEEGESLAAIADVFNMERPAVTRALEGFALYRFVQNLGCWNPDERAALEDDDLELNPFTRLFNYSRPRRVLGLSFGKMVGELNSTLKPELFEKGMEQIARACLLDKTATTRTPIEEALRIAFSGYPELMKLLGKNAAEPPGKPPGNPRPGGPSGPGPGNGPTGGPGQPTGGPGNGPTPDPPPPPPPQPPRPKPDAFFESLVCKVPDNHLRALAIEIAKIKPKDFPSAATFLLRALVEKTLDWCLRKRNLLPTLYKEAQEKKKTKGKPEPGLEFVVRFCIRHHDEIFARDVRRALDRWLGEKVSLDLAIHGLWIEANEHRLKQAATAVRSIIYDVLQGSLLREDAGPTAEKSALKQSKKGKKARS